MPRDTKQQAVRGLRPSRLRADQSITIDDDALCVKDAARALGANQATVYLWLRDGTLDRVPMTEPHVNRDGKETRPPIRVSAASVVEKLRFLRQRERQLLRSAVEKASDNEQILTPANRRLLRKRAARLKRKQFQRWWARHAMRDIAENRFDPAMYHTRTREAWLSSYLSQHLGRGIQVYGRARLGDLAPAHLVDEIKNRFLTRQ